MGVTKEIQPLLPEPPSPEKLGELRNQSSKTQKMKIDLKTVLACDVFLCLCRCDCSMDDWHLAVDGAKHKPKKPPLVCK